MPTDDAFFIINTKVSDQGIYTCTAENAAGIVKTNGSLIVHGTYTHFVFFFFNQFFSYTN